MLASGMKVSIDRHYCGGQLAEIKVSFSGKPATCGMETEENIPSGLLSFESKCCEDQIISYNIAGKFVAEQSKSMLQPSWEKIQVSTRSGDVLNPANSTDNPDSPVMPPGENPVTSVSLSRICVLRT